ncbi:MAG TPA: single-stranded-DNA-specific exonuclease RecJ [Clostridia bacterium]|nr:single-stranded-DNA-specific exonuclease RecJ [Clostridia bacterium]
MVSKVWEISECDKNKALEIAQRHGLNPFSALIAVSRGLTDSDDIEEFFSTESSALTNPFDLPDMEKAVKRINNAIDNFERIAIFGDYDADGVCATALVYSFLEMQGADAFYYIPDRQTEGYGLSIESVDKLHKLGAKVIITVDNGIRSINEAKYASELGMDLIITDHHIVGDELPEAVAVINPHREDCKLKFKDLAGVGVAFKLISALGGINQEELLSDYGDIVAIGTVADVVPLKGENRSFVKAGLKAINENIREGIWALRQTAGYDENKPLTSKGIAFTVAPRINAAGRMGAAKRAVELLLSEDEATAQNIAQDIEQANTDRKLIGQDILEQVEKQISQSPRLLYDRVLVCDGEGWHHGVIGIVASRIVERYGKPCIIISRDGENAKGSGRSLDGFSLFDAIEECSDLLDFYGGHTLAAGLSLKSDNISGFRTKINDYSSTFQMPFLIQKIDLKINPKFIGMDVIDGIQVFEPFGFENSQPVFGLFNMTIKNIAPTSNGKHIKLVVQRGDTSIRVMSFGQDVESFEFRCGDVVDLAVVLDKNEYLNNVYVGVYLKSIRYSNMDEKAIQEGIRSYEMFKRGEALPCKTLINACPERELMADIYRAIKSNNGWNRGTQALLNQIGNLGERFCAVNIALDVFEEMGLLIVDNYCYNLPKISKKVSLDDSIILKSLNKHS